MSAWEELGLSEEEFDELDLQWDEDTGGAGEMVYGYVSYVPEHTPAHILQRNDWAVGDTLEVSVNAFDDENEGLCPECMDNPCSCAEMNRYIQEQVDRSDREDRRRS